MRVKGVERRALLHNKACPCLQASFPFSLPSLTSWPQNVLPRTDYRANGPLLSGHHGVYGCAQTLI